MLKYLNRLPNEYEECLNKDIIFKRFDKPIQEYIWKAFQALEILPNIRLLGYEWISDEEKYDQNNHIVRRNSNKNKAIKDIAETRCGVMYLDIEVRGFNRMGQMEVHYLKKALIIPIEDEKGYYLIKGKNYYMIYQLLDKMLYPSFGAVTLKSLMPICVKTIKSVVEDYDGKSYTIPTYTIQIFKTAINVLLIYSNYTVTKMLHFMEVSRFIKVLEKGTYERDPNYLYFPCGKRSDIDVAVFKPVFDEEIYIRSITACLIHLFIETTIKYEDIDNWEEWMMIVGGRNTVKRGIYQHISFNRLLDDTTRDELKINDYDKQNIYCLLRWIIQNYHKLWAKDNLAMENKRLRCNEYLAAFITQELSDRINKIISLGDKADIKEYLKMFRLPSDIFMTKLYNSGVLRFAESNSDISYGNLFKATKKGPQALGNKNTRRIPIRQRTLHPSMLGRIDISSSSSSDPGQSLHISPYNDMKSLYFDDSLYENEMHFKIAQYLDKYPLSGDYEELRINRNNTDDYNAVLDALHRAGEGKFKMYGKLTNPLEIVVEADPRLSYRKFNEDYVMTEEDSE